MTDDDLCDCDRPIPITRPVTPRDRLLEKINGPVFKETSANTIAYWRSAIRAVVELHKPFEIDREGNYNCQECEWAYPCPTIQALQEELWDE